MAGVCRGRLGSLSSAVYVSATVSVAFETHGPWSRFVEYQMSNAEYQTNLTHVYKSCLSFEPCSVIAFTY